MVNSPLKPDGRKLAEFIPLKPAEQKLLDACRSGEEAVISEQRPEQADDNNIVRASFLRFLALGGDEFAPVNERGVLLQGAWVENELNIESAFLPHGLGLRDCHLTNIILRHSNIHGCVGFQGCYVVNGISADGMVCSGGVFLKDFTSTGPVRLLNTQLGGNLECHGGKFDVKNDDALICDRAVIQGSVFLNDSEKGSNKVRFIATGIVSFMAARINGSLDCSNAVFNGTPRALECDRAVINGSVFLKNGFTATGSVCLAGTQIGGNLEFNDATLDGMNDFALRAAGMTVVGAFHFSDMRSIKGIVSLSSAKVGRLIDDNKSWAKAELILDGFIYDKLTGKAPTDAKNRLAWLDKQLVSHAGLEGDGKDFKPQPWQQLQKVLREMGHVEDARQVAIAFEKRLLCANLIGQTPENWCKLTACVYRKISRGFHRLFGWLIGYGYRPLGLFIKMVVVWLLCGAFYLGVARYGNGVFAPSNPLVFQNSEYDVCKADNEKAQAEMIKAAYGLPSVQGAGNWYLCKDLREEYTGFSPLAYSLDLILPLVDLQQEHDWAPMIPTPEATGIDELKARSLKHVTRLVVWIEILFGWVSSLLLVAVVSGLTKRREE